MQFSDIRSLVANELEQVNAHILNQLNSKIPLIEQVGEHLINSGGKRLRPTLLLLAAKACGYTGTQHISLAAIIEFIHTATLLHDDVVDDSHLRRGQDTANAIWGNSTSVLVGDFVYSRSFQMMVNIENMQVMRILADTTNRIAEGEVLQLLQRHNPDASEASYREVIHYKTAILFAAATQLAAVISNVDHILMQQLTQFGLHLGIAFQLIDDALDYSADSKTIGKNIGDDLAEGKTTLPLIYALEHAEPQQRELLRAAIKQGDLQKLPAIQQAIASTNALSYTTHAAKRESEQAIALLTGLAPSVYRDALTHISHFVVDREQ